MVFRTGKCQDYLRAVHKEQQNTLQILAQHWHDRDFVLIGATALGCAIPMDWRKTNDLDIVVAVDVDEYPGGLEKLDGWCADRFEHRWT